jgi:uncharacterized OB-fold protein
MTIDSRVALPPPAGLATIDMNVWTRPFWDAAARHVLALPRCAACGHFRMPPTPFCPVCRSQTIDWTEIAGNGFIYSYTIVERAIISGTGNQVPYVPAIIALPEAGGVRLISNIVGSLIERIAVDAPVRLLWHDLPDGTVLPQFRLAQDGDL